MSKDIAKLVIRMEAQTKKYDQKLDQANKKIKRFHKQQRKSLKGISSDFKTILGGVAVGLFVRKIVNATKEQEQAVAQLEQGLATTGNVVGYSLEQLTKKAEELQKVTTFGDEQIIRAMSKLVTFTGITEKSFDRTTESVLDLATRMEGDLTGAIVQLGKALNDPVANLGALGRAGVQFNDSQKAMIKDLVESNKLMEAQDIILTELEKQFGGSARRARDTFGGALDGLTDAFGDLFEATEGLEGAAQSVESLTTALQSDDITETINTLISGFIQLASLSLEFVGNVDDVINKLTSYEGSFSTAADARSNLSAIQIEQEVEIKFTSGSSVSGIGQGNHSIIKKEFEKQISDNVGALTTLIGKQDVDELRKTLSAVVDLTKKAAEDMVAGIDASKNKQLIDNLVPLGEMIKGQIGLLNERKLAIDAAKADADKNTLSLPKPTEAHIDAFKDYNAEMQKLADTITIANVPAAKFESELAKLNEVWDSGKLGAEAYSSAFLSLLEDFEGLPDKTEEVAGEMDEFAEQAARNMQDAFADFLFDPFDEGLDGMLKGFLKILQRMAAEQLAANIFGGLTGLFGAATPGGAPIVDALPTMNGGGDTGSGPRVGGVDGLGGFLAILHPNETVTDHTLQGSAKGGGGITIAPQFSLSAIDSRGMSDVIQEQQGAIISVIDQYLNEKGIAAI